MALPANPLATEQQICIDYNRQSIKLAAMYLFQLYLPFVDRIFFCSVSFTSFTKAEDKTTVSEWKVNMAL